jgi:Leucine-rich repeat (LRR) protein
VPTWIGELRSLQKLFLNSNQFIGSLPIEFGQLTSLKLLTLGNKYLKDTIGSWIRELRLLEELHLYNNEFTGLLPSELNYLEKLTVLSIENNQFTGAFDIDRSNLTDLCFSDNMFTGELPSEIETKYDCSVGLMHEYEH